jgi:hypothetical protein
MHDRSDVQASLLHCGDYGCAHCAISRMSGMSKPAMSCAWGFLEGGTDERGRISLINFIVCTYPPPP